MRLAASLAPAMLPVAVGFTMIAVALVAFWSHGSFGVPPAATRVIQDQETTGNPLLAEQVMSSECPLDEAVAATEKEDHEDAGPEPLAAAEKEDWRQKPVFIAAWLKTETRVVPEGIPAEGMAERVYSLVVPTLAYWCDTARKGLLDTEFGGLLLEVDPVLLRLLRENQARCIVRLGVPTKPDGFRRWPSGGGLLASAWGEIFVGEKAACSWSAGGSPSNGQPLPNLFVQVTSDERCVQLWISQPPGIEVELRLPLTELSPAHWMPEEERR